MRCAEWHKHAGNTLTRGCSRCARAAYGYYALAQTQLQAMHLTVAVALPMDGLRRAQRPQQSFHCLLALRHPTAILLPAQSKPIPCLQTDNGILAEQCRKAPSADHAVRSEAEVLKSCRCAAVAGPSVARQPQPLAHRMLPKMVSLQCTAPLLCIKLPSGASKCSLPCHSS